jgi:hypothetical protein
MESNVEEYLRQLQLGMQGVGRGVAQTADVLATPVAGALNLVNMGFGGRPVFQAGPTEATLQALYRNLGAPQPRTEGEQLVNDGVAFTTGATIPLNAPASLVGKLSAGSGKIGQAVKNALSRYEMVPSMVDATTGQGFKLPTEMALEGSRMLPKRVQEVKVNYPHEGKTVTAASHDFKSGGENFQVVFKPLTSNSVELMFTKHKPDGTMTDAMDSSERPSEVLANVLQSTKDYVKKYAPEEVVFNAATADKSRTKVYESIAKRYKPEGYDMEIIYKPSGPYNTFKFTRREKK